MVTVTEYEIRNPAAGDGDSRGQTKHLGPFYYNGETFLLVIDNVITPDTIFLHSNNGGSFSEQDDFQTLASGQFRLSAEQDGSTIHIVFGDNTGTGMTAQVSTYYLSVDLTTRTFAASATTIHDAAGEVFPCATDIVARSNGDLIAVCTVVGSNMGADYPAVGYSKSTDNGANWSVPVQVSSGPENETSNDSGGMAYLGASDRVHFTWDAGITGTSATELAHRSLSSADVLDTEAVISSLADQNGKTAFDGSTTMRTVFWNDSTNLLDCAEYTSQADPTFSVSAISGSVLAYPSNQSRAIGYHAGQSTWWVWFIEDVALDTTYLISDSGSGWDTPAQQNDLSSFASDASGDIAGDNFGVLIYESTGTVWNYYEYNVIGPIEGETTQAIALTTSIDSVVETEGETTQGIVADVTAAGQVYYGLVVEDSRHAVSSTSQSTTTTAAAGGYAGSQYAGSAYAGGTGAAPYYYLVEHPPATPLSAQESLHAHASDEVALTEHSNLVVLSSVHLHSSGEVSLTENAAVTPEDSLHGHTSEEVALTHEYSVVPGDSLHGHTSDEVTATHEYSVAPEDSLHTHTSDEVTATHEYSVAPGDSLHGHTSDEVTATHEYSVVPEDSLHGHTSEEVTLSAAYQSSPQDSSHGHVSDQVTVTEHASLLVQDSVHSHSSDEVTAVPAGTLAVLESTHGHSSEEVALTEHASVTVEDAHHGHTSEQVALSATYAVAPEDSTHAHASEQVSVTEHASLVVGDALHAHTSDEVTATPKDGVGVNDSTHGHTSEEVTLTEHAAVSPSDSLHGHTSEEVTLSAAYVVTPEDSLHGHTSDEVTITPMWALAVDGSTHTHVSDEVTILGVLNANDSRHALTSSQPELTGDGVDAGIGKIKVFIDGDPTPATAKVYVNGEFRQASVKVYRDGAFV